MIELDIFGLQQESQKQYTVVNEKCLDSTNITWNKVVFSKKLNIILEAKFLSPDDKFVVIDDGSEMAPTLFVGA